MIVLLDSGPLGIVTNSSVTPLTRECNIWLQQMLHNGHLVTIPEIVDYEVRRELLRGRRSRSLMNLNMLTSKIVFVPITTPVMRMAAEFWASARQQGIPTADDRALDGGMILAAQAVLLEQTWEQDAIIATTNVRHLVRFARAQEWREVS